MFLHVIVKKRFACPFCGSSIFVYLHTLFLEVRVNEEIMVIGRY